jgi:hypothetical protein
MIGKNLDACGGCLHERSCVQPRLHPWSQASFAVATRVNGATRRGTHRVEHSRVGTQQTAPAGPRWTTTHKWGEDSRWIWITMRVNFTRGPWVPPKNDFDSSSRFLAFYVHTCVASHFCTVVLPVYVYFLKNGSSTYR